MKFPWNKYKELPVNRINTLQVFITNRCNLKCNGCFARNIIGEHRVHMQPDEYLKTIRTAVSKGVERITLIGGEPLMHPHLKEFVEMNYVYGLKTTIYSNGYHLDNYSEIDLLEAKIRVSLYCKSGKLKSVENLPKTDIKYDVCFMVSKTTSVDELLETAKYLEENTKTTVFFISSLRELDNPNQEFFDDTDLTMPVMEYKKLVHEFLNKYEFANYFIGGKIIQCPYDVVNKKFTPDYQFDERYCQHNSTCLMSKIRLKRIIK
jgi:organic radical activating enzyme